MTISEVAKVLGVCKRTLSRWSRNGVLPSERVLCKYRPKYGQVFYSKRTIVIAKYNLEMKRLAKRIKRNIDNFIMVDKEVLKALDSGLIDKEKAFSLFDEENKRSEIEDGEIDKDFKKLKKLEDNYKIIINTKNG